MSKKKEAKKFDCVVIRNGFIIEGEELKLGTVLGLTEKQIKGFSGKVKLKDDVDAEQESSAMSPSDVKQMMESFEELSDELNELKEANSKLTAVNADLTKKIETATKAKS